MSIVLILKKKTNLERMTGQALYKLRFPIGEFKRPERINASTISSWISTMEAFPQDIENITKPLTSEELNWTYRPNGWNIKQVVHHCADSHMNCIIRFKLALTEDTPTIRPYHEDRWALLIDNNDEHLDDSILLLKGLHSKLGTLLRHISEKELTREFIHPEHGKRYRLDENIGVYAWHCNHHLAHIKKAIACKGQI